MEKRVHDGSYKTSNNHLKKRAQRGSNPASDQNPPEPTLPIVDQKKKSHAKKQPEGHIPRPKNAFILYRCYFVASKKIPKSVENDHRNISRIVGKIWQQMSAEQKEPWRQKAEQEKIAHHKKYPNYKFVSGPSRKKSKRGDDKLEHEEPTTKEEELNVALSRASSCPPGDEVVPQAVFESSAPAYGDPLRTRDDLSRRPSRVVFYRSAPNDLATVIDQPGFFNDHANQHYFAQALGRHETISYPLEEHLGPSGSGENVGSFCGPRMGSSHFPIPDHNTPPEWENDLLMHTIDELYPSRLGESSNPHDDRITIPESMFTDPFRSTLPPLPRSVGGSEISLDSLDSLPSPGSYRGDSSQAHEQDVLVLEGLPSQQAQSVNELSEDIIAEKFSRNSIGHSDEAPRP